MDSTDCCHSLRRDGAHCGAWLSRHCAAAIPLPPAQAFARAEAAARAMGGDIVAVSPQDLRIEATDTSLLFGFKDDVVIRVAALADVSTASSRVDVRSLSRVGGSDFGVNAKRIRDYLARLAAG